MDGYGNVQNHRAPWYAVPVLSFLLSLLLIVTDCGYTRVVAIVLDEHLAQRVSVEVNAPHLYYLNGILCHNKYACQ